MSLNQNETNEPTHMELELKNVKGVTGRWTFGPVAVVAGPNGTGKTALLDAVTLAIAGSHPRHGGEARPTALIETIGSPAGMSYGITIAGATRGVRIIPKGKSYKAEASADPLGTLDTISIAEFLALPARHRAGYVIERSTIPDNLNQSVLVSSLRGIDGAGTQAASSLIRDVSGIRGENTLDWVQKVTEAVRDAGRAAKNDLKSIAGAIDMHNASEIPEVAEEPANTFDQEEYARVCADVVRLGNDISNAQEASRKSEQVLRRISELRESVEDGGETLSKLMDEHTDWSLRLDGYTQKRFAIETGRQELREKISGLRSERTSADRVLDDVSSRVRKAQEKLDGISKLTGCPVCHSDHEGWRFKVEDEARETLLAEQKSQEEARQRVETAQKELDEAFACLSDLDGKLREVSEAIVEAQAEIRDLNSDINQIRGDKSALEKAEAEASLAGILPPEEIEKMVTQHSDLVRRMTELAGIRDGHAAKVREHAKQVAARDAWTEQGAKLDKMREEAEGAVIWMLDAAKCVDQFRVAIADATVGPILSAANAVLHGITPWSLGFSGSEFGYTADGGTFVGLDAMSGSEQRLAAAAIAVAFGTRASGPKVVLIDELGTFDRDRRDRLIERILSMVEAGTIHQFIGTDVSGDGYGDGVDVVRVGRKEVA